MGGVGVLISQKRYRSLIVYLVSFSAGSLLAGALVHLIPEAIENLGNNLSVSLLVLLGIFVFYVLEQFIHWHHCHRLANDHVHPVSYLVIIADMIHNFLDGLAVASAFVLNTQLGIATLIAVIAHEIPQELGDFGILIYSGWTVRRALVFNLLSSLTFFIAALLVIFVAENVNVLYLIPVTAGSFIYIAAVDLLPQINKDSSSYRRFLHFLSFVVGAGILVVLRIFFAE